MHPNLLEIKTEKDFLLFCSLFDLHNGNVFQKDLVKKTERGFSYVTSIVESDQYYIIRIDLIDGMRRIFGLNRLYEINDDVPVEIRQSLEYIDFRVYENYVVQKFLLEDIEEIKAKFNRVYEAKSWTFDESTYEAKKPVLYLANHSIFKLKQMLKTANGMVKDKIYETCIDILEKTAHFSTLTHIEDVDSSSV